MCTYMHIYIYKYVCVFSDVFANLLNASQVNFDKIFKRTYGVIYQQNSEIFNDLFRLLREYHADGRSDLDQDMKKFFETLYQKLFTVFNSQYIFSDQ